MEFKQGSEVVSSDGERVGTVKWVVLDPISKKVGYLVVEKGLLFTQDKIIPVDFVESVEENRILLHETRDALGKLNDFEVTHYVPVSDDPDNVEAYYWYPPLSGVNMGGYPLFPQPLYIEHTERNIPENYVALKEGARVIAEDGQDLGIVERVIADTKTDRATHFVISSGGLLKQRKLIPIHWVKDVSEEEIHLAVDSGFLERLPEFEAGG